ncbi:uncharacterized protein STEHIDRAFT_48341 [Stereum hirsutum FP-91666 SS1]|uniref:uncharacterized protein n=1 Tax=Stereum hirsutum (strain FP-91666) TaxID=721885 RepID=UPI0004410327|nr:uncharacterized protein STEHIDRAFT_48341 [Stereum hirsutum FP-91666 SS1]EIM91505.1 hypothetical protein STEHIDRAFT_48341 [Stereum hirsutum FP-91666 SS1]
MVSRQPFPQTSATSASAWGALLRSHMNNVEPIISQWRGTLDTLLIFVALFSAIVTALYAQSLTNLAPDTGERTNELLQNLTEVIIVLQGASAAQFNFTQPSLFEPAAGVIRLNFYFSISLVLSVSAVQLDCTSIVNFLLAQFSLDLRRCSSCHESRICRSAHPLKAQSGPQEIGRTTPTLG